MPKGMMGGPGGKQVEKAKDFKGTTKKLIKNYLADYKIAIIIVIIFAIGSTIFSIVGPKILGNATKRKNPANNVSFVAVNADTGL